MRKEKELIYQQQLRQDLLDRKMDRREFISKTLTAGLGLAGVGVISNFGNFTYSTKNLLNLHFRVRADFEVPRFDFEIPHHFLSLNEFATNHFLKHLGVEME